MILQPPSIDERTAGRIGMAVLAAVTPFGSAASEQFQNTDVEEVGGMSLPQPEGDGSTFTVVFSEYKESWDASDVRRFKDLAKKRALQTISGDEQKEFRALQEARRRLENPLKTDQIMAEVRRSRMQKDLLQFLEKHYRFFDTTNKAWSRSDA